ncbi:MAG: helix-turn-helix domain-containing protein [Sphingomonas taxi]
MQRRAVKSAMRTFEVLELFAERRRPMALNEIYSELGYPQSSTTNLLKSMVLLGYLNYNRTKRTLPADDAAQPAGQLGRGLHPVGGGLPRLGRRDAAAHRRDGWPVDAERPVHHQYLFLHGPEHEFKNMPPDGTMRLLVDSSGGRAMMARMGNRAIDKLCRYNQPLRDEERSRQLCRDHEGHQLDPARRLLLLPPNWPTPDVSSISIALDADLHGIPLAIGVGGLADRIARKKADILEIMREMIAEFNERHAAGAAANADDVPGDADDGGDESDGAVS